jgi:hypothetical protein
MADMMNFSGNCISNVLNQSVDKLLDIMFPINFFFLSILVSLYVLESVHGLTRRAIIASLSLSSQLIPKRKIAANYKS